MATLFVLLLLSVAMVRGCDVPEDYDWALAAVYDCYLQNKDKLPCMVPCCLQSLKLVDEKGVPNAQLAMEKALAIPEDFQGYRNMNVGLATCVKKHGHEVDPQDTENNCVSYSTIGLCMRNVVQKECPDFV